LVFSVGIAVGAGSFFEDGNFIQYNQKGDTNFVSLPQA